MKYFFGPVQHKNKNSEGMVKKLCSNSDVVGGHGFKISQGYPRVYWLLDFLGNCLEEKLYIIWWEIQYRLALILIIQICIQGKSWESPYSTFLACDPKVYEVELYIDIKFSFCTHVNIWCTLLWFIIILYTDSTAQINEV